MGLGATIANWIGPRWIIVAEIAAPFHVAVASGCVSIFKDQKIIDGLWPAGIWPLAGAVLVALVTWVSRSQKAAAIGAAAKETLEKYKRDAAGNLARLLRTLLNNTNDIRDIQSALLRQATEVVRAYLNLDHHDERIAATWVVPVNNFSQWVTVAYDKNRAHRQPGRKRDIKDGIPGASEAFLSGNRKLIADTADPAISQHFPPNPPYRCILSVPARIMNVREGNVVIGGNQDMIPGVLNIDGSEPNLLREDVSNVVQDIAYLIAVLEHLGGHDAEHKAR